MMAYMYKLSVKRKRFYTSQLKQSFFLHSWPQSAIVTLHFVEPCVNIISEKKFQGGGGKPISREIEGGVGYS